MMGHTIEVHMLFRRARRRISENSVSLMEEILQQADDRMGLARATARAAYQLRYEQVLREAEREAGNVHRIEELEKQRRLFEGKERRLDTGT